MLKTNERDCWVLSQENEVLKFISAEPNKNLVCQKVKSLSDFYTQPLKSSFLNIFEGKNELEPPASYLYTDIKSKLFAVQSSETSHIFFPLLHSYQEL